MHELFQSEYKAHHRTETALLTITNDISLLLDRGDNVFLLLMNLSAAFDTVNHSLLLSRLENSFGITGTVLQWFHFVLFIFFSIYLFYKPFILYYKIEELKMLFVELNIRLQE